MNPLSFILESLYPSFCRHCEILIQKDGIFCADCLSQIKEVVPLILPVTTTQKLTVFAAGQYEGQLKKLVTRKFAHDLLAARQLGQLILDLTPIKHKKIDYIVPIPLHWSRYARRGFNQASEMAHAIEKELNVQFIKALGRVRKTRYQSACDRQGRQENVKKAFGLGWRYRHNGLGFLKDKNVLLVDDLCTTGATLVQASRVLAYYRPASIIAVVGARAV